MESKTLVTTNIFETFSIFHYFIRLLICAALDLTCRSIVHETISIFYSIVLHQHDCLQDLVWAERKH